jgi:hypothetical protein
MEGEGRGGCNGGEQELREGGGRGREGKGGEKGAEVVMEANKN